MHAFRPFLSRAVSGAAIFAVSLLSMLMIEGCGTGDQAEIYPVFKLDYKAGEVSDATIEYDGRTRRFLYYVPNDFDPEAKHPLILILHGFNQPVETIVSGYAAAQERAGGDGTILVYPVATGSFEEQSLAWNTRYGTFANTRFPETDEVDDVGFLSRLIDVFIGNMKGDPDRVYVTGTSMGGAMTYALSCYIPERLAAIAPVIAQIGSKFMQEFAMARPLPIMIITGTADPLVSEKGIGGDPAKDMLPLVSTGANIDYWKTRNGIAADPVETALPDPVIEVFKGVETPSRILQYFWKSETGNDIVWLKVVNGGHWLPTYANGRALDASDLDGFDGSYMGTLNCDYMASAGIYDFLLSHTRKSENGDGPESMAE